MSNAKGEQITLQIYRVHTVFEEFLGQCNHSNHSLLLQQKGLISFQLIRENNLSEFGRMWQNSILVFI